MNRVLLAVLGLLSMTACKDTNTMDSGSPCWEDYEELFHVWTHVTSYSQEEAEALVGEEVIVTMSGEDTGREASITLQLGEVQYQPGGLWHVDQDDYFYVPACEVVHLAISVPVLGATVSATDSDGDESAFGGFCQYTGYSTSGNMELWCSE